MTREIILDTETTGLDPKKGDRIIEIGCLELENLQPTGRQFQAYINPERSVSEKTIEITGLTDAHLVDKPVFADIVESFLEFIGDDPLIIHNASFDMGFLNAELERAQRPILSRNIVIDTLDIARKKFPGSPASLDALCRRFNIDNSNREKHGAILDSELLAEVYLELMGGRQPGLIFQANASQETRNEKGDKLRHTENRPQARRETELSARLTAHELEAHERFLDKLPASAMWRHE